MLTSPKEGLISVLYNLDSGHSGKILKDLFSCPVCGNRDFKYIFSVPDRFNLDGNERFSILECSTCQVRLTYPPPDEKEIERYYKSAAYDPFITGKADKSFRDRIYLFFREIQLRQKRRWIERLVPSGTICDYGCSTGEFLNTLSGKRWERVGFEKDRKALEIARRTGLDVYSDGDFRNYENPLNVITLWHVLEHVHRLHDLLGKFQELLVDQGFLVLALPNYRGRDAEIYGESWVAYDAPRHLYHFIPGSLHRLLSQYGFSLKSLKPLIFDTAYNCLLSEEIKRYPGKKSFSNLALNIVKTYTSMVLSSGERSSSFVYFYQKSL